MNFKVDMDMKKINKGRKNKSGNVLRQSWFVFTIHNTTVNCSTGYE